MTRQSFSLKPKVADEDTSKSGWIWVPEAPIRYINSAQEVSATKIRRTPTAENDRRRVWKTNRYGTLYEEKSGT
jgi:hypothetical protein